MTTLEAAEKFLSMLDKSWWYVPPEREEAPALMTALAAMSGRLDDAASDADLRDAVEHGLTLISCGVLATMQVADEARRIEREIAEYCEQFESRMASIAEWN